MGVFPKAQVKRIIKSAGAEMVSRDATDRMNQLMEDRALELTSLVVEIAKHAGRKTVRDEDFMLLDRIHRTLT